MTMEDHASVAAFHQQGSQDGPLLPVYHFNATATSRRVAVGGTVLDLGSGSGQYLAYLAKGRPDLRIIGVDLSPMMVKLGREALRESGLAERVELIEGDMTDVVRLAPKKVDLVSSVFALHHLPSAEALGRCLNETARLWKRDACAIWIFDHARPRHPATCDLFPAVFTPDAPALFNTDSSNSLRAAFTFEELSMAIADAGIQAIEHRLARVLRLYQVHSSEHTGNTSCDPNWQGAILPRKAAREHRQLVGLFPGLLRPPAAGAIGLGSVHR